MHCFKLACFILLAVVAVELAAAAARPASLSVGDPSVLPHQHFPHAAASTRSNKAHASSSMKYTHSEVDNGESIDAHRSLQGSTAGASGDEKWHARSLHAFQGKDYQIAGSSSISSSHGASKLQSHSSSALTLQFGRSETDLANTYTMTPDSTWSNGSFASSLCGVLSQYSGIVITPSDSTYFLLPSCFFSNSASLVTVSLTKVIIVPDMPGSHPLYRFRSLSSMTSFSLNECILLNYGKVDYEVTQDDWQSLFSEVTNLKSIAVVNSALEGVLPSSLPPSMHFFDVSNNKIRGTIPSSLFANVVASSIELSIGLSQNQLNGTIPGDLWTHGGQFSGLQTLALFLDSNSLQGTIPSDLLNLSSAATAITSVALDLSSNALQGSIPEDLLEGISEASGSLTTLRIDFSDNAFNSRFPTSLFNYTKLSSVTTLSVDMSACDLSGSLPLDIFSGWSSLSTLNFDVSGNQLSGSIPATLISPDDSNSIRTIKVNLGYNKLSGSLPADGFGGLNLKDTTEIYFYFNDNELTGDLPSRLCSSSQSELSTNMFLNVQNNPLNGSIPASFFESINPASDIDVAGFDRSNNERYSLSDSPQLIFTLFASDTQLTGTLFIPDLTPRSQLQSFMLSINVASGSFTGLDIDGNAYQYLNTLNLSGNAEMSGTIPKSLFFSNSTLRALNGDSSGLIGVFPDLGSLQPTRLSLLKMDFVAGIDFCAESRSSWTSTSSICSLEGTNIRECPSMYPSSCSSYSAAPLPSPSTPTPLTPTSCSSSTRPSDGFECIDGKWTSNTHYTDPVLNIPPGARQTVINGNLNSTTVVINGLGSSILVDQCALGIFNVRLILSTEEFESIDEEKSQSLLSYRCSENMEEAQITVKYLGSTGCKRIIVVKDESNESLSTVIKIDNNRCGVWWKGLICGIFGAGFIVGIILALIWSYHREKDSHSDQTKGG